MLGRSENEKKLIFLSFVGSNYSRSGTILNFKDSTIKREYFALPNGWLKITAELVRNRQELRNCLAIVVMSPCQMLVPFTRAILGVPIILDAGWPLTDGHISRGFGFKRLIRLPIIFSIDFIAFHLSRIILVETNSQVARIQKFFWVKTSKLQVSFTGLNEQEFRQNLPLESKLKDTIQSRVFREAQLRVLFRGKINAEAGIERILGTSSMMNSDCLFIFAIGAQDKIENLPINAIVVSELTSAEMAELYLRCDICIGQVSDHPRLKFTIPHKAFEAAYFAKPYISADTNGIRELFNEEEVLFLQNTTTENIWEVIQSLSDSTTRSKYSRKIRDRYNQSASQEVINANFDEIVNKFIR